MRDRLGSGGVIEYLASARSHEGSVPCLCVVSCWPFVFAASGYNQSNLTQRRVRLHPAPPTPGAPHKCRGCAVSGSAAWRRALIRFRWTNGKVVRFSPGYEGCNVSLTTGNVEVNLSVAVFVPHPHMSRTAVGGKRHASRCGGLGDIKHLDYCKLICLGFGFGPFQNRSATDAVRAVHQ